MLEPARLLAVPAAALAHACAHEEVHAQAFGAVLAAEARALAQRFGALSTTDAAARVASGLLHEAATRGSDRRGTHRTLSQRKQTIAQHFGTTAETLSRIRARLHAQGTIAMPDYEITLLDTDAARSAAGNAHRPARRVRADPAAAPAPAGPGAESHRDGRPLHQLPE